VHELTAQRLVAPFCRLNHLAVQGLEIALHPLEGRARRAFECRIERRNRLNDALHLLLDRPFRLRERLFDRGGNLCLEQFVQRRFVLRLQRFERKLVFGQEPQGRGIQNRRGGARIHQRHRHAEVLVDAAQLAKVGQLVRSRDVAHRREERVLHHGPQQHVGTEPGRLLGRLLHERRCRVRLVADQEAAVLLADGAAAAVEMKERDALIVLMHLRVIAARGEVRSGERRELSGLARHRQLTPEHLADERL
jgi:hypothetical protein